MPHIYDTGHFYIRRYPTLQYAHCAVSHHSIKIATVVSMQLKLAHMTECTHVPGRPCHTLLLTTKKLDYHHFDKRSQNFEAQKTAKYVNLVHV